MMERIMSGCLTLVLAATCLGQAANTSKPQQDDELQLKRQRVGALRDQILLQLPGEIKAADEPALRAFLRLRLVTYIWEKKNAPAELTGLAEGVASEALADLDQHKSEIPPRLGWLPRDFLAQLQMHAPALAARLAEKYGLNQSASADQLGDALSRLNSNGGAGSAIELVRAGLRGGRDPGFKMRFFLTELDQKRPDEVPRLLSEILDVAERFPGSISLDTFHWLSDFYLREQTSAGLKTRFLAYVVAGTKDAYTWTDEALKLIASADDGAAKAIAYLEASTTHPKVDAVKVLEIVAAATKAIDNVPSPGAFERPDSAARVKYVNDLYSLAWTIVPTFRALAQRDETEALTAAEKIRRRDIRAAAKFGAFVGLGELNAPAQPQAK